MTQHVATAGPTRALSLRCALGGLALAALAAGPAVAQKSADTIRLAVNDPFSVLDSYHFPLDEAGAFSRTIQSTLIAYDEHKGIWVPRLAKAWRRISPTTLEFDLRDDVKFHNGQPFDGKDVRGTLMYLADPKVKIRFKGRYSWVKDVEIINPYKIRIVSKKPFSTDLSTIAYRMRMFDIETWNSLKDPAAEYGRTSPGTGPYKVVSLERSKGVLVERVNGHWDKSGYDRAPVKRVQGIFMPDRQTQIAQLVTGGIDLMRNITGDQARELGAQRGLGVTATPSSFILYVTLDAKGRSKNKVMTDKRVRQAFIQAIDRQTILKNVVPGGQIARSPQTICFKYMIACDPTPATKIFPHDLANAKRLLAEAGFPNGFELTLYAHQPVAYIANAVAGEVRKAGIRASVEPLPIASYVRKRREGEFTAFMGFYPAGTHPDVQNMWNFFFGGDRDYWDDPVIDNAAKLGSTESDEKKRTMINQPALERVSTQAYILPFTELPIVWAHNEDVVVDQNPLSQAVPVLGDYWWKKD